MKGIKINSILDFNSFLDEEYKYLNQPSDSWYPIMYYDEDTNLKDKKYMTTGINPSLTENAKHYINEIFEIDISNTNNDNKGEERFNKFRNDKTRKIKDLVNYQHNLKYYNQIIYFKTIDKFFESVDRNFKKDVFHYDFCQLRNTDSGNVNNWLQINKYSNFNRLIIHFDQIIQLIQPDYIFIFNASLVEMLMENEFFHRRTQKNPHRKSNKNHFQYYNEFMDDDGICIRNNTKFIIGNQLSGGATSRVYRANLIANVNRLLKNR